MPPAPIITMLTDFGLADPYVGVMKGVILGIRRDVQFVDLTHQVPPQSIRAGAFLLAAVYRYFPDGTIHLAVVDPGVGSERAAIAAAVGNHRFVAPDNGLLSGVLDLGDPFEAVYLENPQFFRHPVSQSFHGRDIFAPVAAHLADGVPLDALGPRCTNPQRCEFSAPQDTASGLKGEVVYVDHFGNLITNLPQELVEKVCRDSRFNVQIGPHAVSGPADCYAAVPSGVPLALFTSFGLLEIAVRDGHAAGELGVSVGAEVRITCDLPTDPTP